MTDQIDRTWGDEATESGACAIAMLLILQLTEYTIVRRSTGTGIDYWLGYREKKDIFEDAARLEVSGIAVGNKSDITTRVRQKKKQTKPTDEGGWPAYIVVVEFGTPQAQVEKK